MQHILYAFQYCLDDVAKFRNYLRDCKMKLTTTT